MKIFEIFRNHLSGDGLSKQLLRGGLSGILARGFALVAGLVMSVTLARVLGPAEFGLYSFVFAVVTLLGLPVRMGMETLVIRETARFYALQDWSGLRGIWLWAAGYISFSGLIVIGFTLLLLPVFNDIISTVKINALLYGLSLVPVMALLWSVDAAQRGLKCIFLGTFGGSILRPLLLAGFVFLAATASLSGKIMAAHALLLHSAAAIIAILTSAFFLFRVRPPEMDAESGYRFEQRRWFTALAPLGMISGFQLLLANTDSVMLGFLGTNEAVGYYRVALKVSSLMVFGLTTLNAVIQPYIADLYAKDDHLRLQKLVSISALVGFGVTLPVALILIPFGHKLISFIFGEGYAVAYVPLLILMIGQTMNAFFGPVGLILNMTGNEQLVLRGIVIAAITNIILNAALIPNYGLIGAAVASFVSTILWNIFFWMSAKRYLGIDGSVFAFF